MAERRDFTLEPIKKFTKDQERPEKIRRFLKPEPVGLPLPLPTGGPELYRAFDSGETPLEGIGAFVRNRYPLTAEIVDAQFEKAEEAYLADPQGEDKKAEYKKALGLVGAFNFVRGMQVFTTDGEVDRNIAPKMMLSPSAAVQILEEVKITNDDKVLDLFCGTGYSIFYWAAAGPARLDAVDKYTSQHYRLEQTFTNAAEEIYAPLPDDLKPYLTKPTFLTYDSAILPKFNTSEAQKQGYAEKYDKIFLHPPYGRESTRLIPDIPEADAFMLWVNSIVSAKDANNGKGEIISVVPAEWKQAVEKIKRGVEPFAAIGQLYGELRGLKYYQFPENQIKLDEPYTLDAASHWTPELFQDTFKQTAIKPLKETGMFGLDLHIIK